jgi:hypothetical protein
MTEEIQPITNDTLVRLSSRKFILALISVISASILTWYGHIADGVYSAVVIATVGAYLAANVTQNAVMK